MTDEGIPPTAEPPSPPAASGRERILAAFRGEPTDRVPCFEQSISSTFASKVLGRPAHTGMGELHLAEVHGLLDRHAEPSGGGRLPTPGLPGVEPPDGPSLPEPATKKPQGDDHAHRHKKSRSGSAPPLGGHTVAVMPWSSAMHDLRTRIVFITRWTAITSILTGTP